MGAALVAAMASLWLGCLTFSATAFTPERSQPIRHRFTVSCAEYSGLRAALNNNDQIDDEDYDEQVDVAIIGAGLGGLCAGALLNTLYGRRVAIYERHYLAGGCAHAFDRKDRHGTTYTFDSGPTILLGCSRDVNPNAMQQVLKAINQTVDWIPYDGWGMLEYPSTSSQEHQQLNWKVQLGGDAFINGPLRQFGGEQAVQEYRALQKLTSPLCAGVDIPAMAMRSGPSAIIPLIWKHFGTLWEIIQQGEAVTGTFAPYMDGPAFVVHNEWLRAWLDALAFSLSGLPANRTAAAAMAFTIQDMHESDATLDYPAGGMGSIVDALVRGVEQGKAGSAVHLRTRVQQIDFDESGSQAVGVTLANGKRIRATEGVISNVPVWSLRSLVEHHVGALQKLQGGNIIQQQPAAPPSSWKMNPDCSASTIGPRQSDDASTKFPASLLEACDTAEQTGSFMHLHLALNATGLDLTKLQAHYTVMDQGLLGADPCAESNMIAVSNPCQIDSTLAPQGTIVIHAYGAGNEPYQYWQGLDRKSDEYVMLKEKRSRVLWRAVESIIPDARDRVLLDLTGSPLTHERFLARPAGTYGSATEDYLKDGSTPIRNFVLAGDGIFPGIGVPSVAINGASAANSLVRYVFCVLRCLNLI